MNWWLLDVHRTACKQSILLYLINFYYFVGEQLIRQKSMCLGFDAFVEGSI